MDFSENYSLKSWYRSLGEKRRVLKVFVLAPVLGGLFMVIFKWAATLEGARIVLKEATPLAESYYESAGYSLEVEAVEGKELFVVSVKKKPSYGYAFGMGALVGLISAGGAAIGRTRRETKTGKHETSSRT